jgi:hypothetical protein
MKPITPLDKKALGLLRYLEKHNSRASGHHLAPERRRLFAHIWLASTIIVCLAVLLIISSRFLALGILSYIFAQFPLMMISMILLAILAHLSLHWMPLGMEYFLPTQRPRDPLQGLTAQQRDSHQFYERQGWTPVTQASLRHRLQRTYARNTYAKQFIILADNQVFLSFDYLTDPQERAEARDLVARWDAGRLENERLLTQLLRLNQLLAPLERN